ncbi:hypothetical protein MMC07_004689 [Pseudocyphellaria aurata]|nr:hypothetical protein [Pseudocyphellaria aurata]
MSNDLRPLTATLAEVTNGGHHTKITRLRSTPAIEAFAFLAQDVLLIRITSEGEDDEEMVVGVEKLDLPLEGADFRSVIFSCHLVSNLRR